MYIIARRVFAVLFFLACLAAPLTAQIKFVQLTDPHLFESERNDAAENQKAFLQAVIKINQLNEHNKYAFVVVTGDIGIEQIFVDKQKIEEAAKTMAEMLKTSDIKVWLFVPGNNDLLDEFPGTIDNYWLFIRALREDQALSQFNITDLCAADRRAHISATNPQYAFVGFNDASFKNNNQKSRIGVKSTTNCDPSADIRCAQENEIATVSRLVRDTTAPFVYIFYHIPETDDPYLLEEEKNPPEDEKLHDWHRTRFLSREVTGSDYQNSSWFISKELRDRWYEVRGDPRVKGLFAGHLHDPNPSRYIEYPRANSEYSKVHICPPLAAKRQPNHKPQARGFCEISIDEDRAQTGGSFVKTLYWYDRASLRFTATSPTQHSLPASTVTPTPSPIPTKGETMTLENLAHLSTVLQLIVVLISLAFIWVQLKQQTDLARVANTQALVALSSPFNLELSRDSKMAEVWHRGSKGETFSDVGIDEQYRSMLKWWLIFYENVYFQTKSGLLDNAISQAWQEDIQRFIDEHPVERYWQSGGREKYYDKFVTFVDECIKKKTAPQKQKE